MESQLKIFELNGKKYFLVDTISILENTYHYFSNLVNNLDVIVMKDEIGKEDFMKSVDDRDEFCYALSLFYDKFHGDNKNTN